MNRCKRCNWNVGQGETLCKDRTACWQRVQAMTANDKARKAGITREAYHAKQLRKSRYWEQAQKNDEW